MHQDGMPLASQVTGRSATRVELITEPGSTRAGVGTEIDHLFCAHGTYAAMTVHTQYSGQRAPNACWAQQPCARIGTVADGPAQPTNLDAVHALGALVDHGRSAGRPA